MATTDSITDRATTNNTIMEALAALHRPGDVVELRIPGSRQGTLSGYYDDWRALTRDAARHDGQVAAVYTTLNPVDPDLKARAYNRLQPYSKHTTADGDIVARRWLPVDLDPVRPAGISSTEAEHRAALDRAEELARWLTGLGWPAPLVADSGNGAHLLYRIDLPADDGGLVNRVLAALAFRFDDERVGTIRADDRLVSLCSNRSAEGAPT